MSEVYKSVTEAVSRVHEIFLEEVHRYRRYVRVYDACLESYYLINSRNGVLDGIEFQGRVLLMDPEDCEDEEIDDEENEQMFLASLRPNLEANKKHRNKRKKILPMRRRKHSDLSKLEFTTWVLEKISVKDGEDRK